MKSFKYLILFFIFSQVLTSCAHNRSSYAYTSGLYEKSEHKENDQRVSKPSSDQKIIYSTSINLTVNIPDSAAVLIENIAKKYNGYIQDKGTNYCRIRVEAKNLKQAENDISLLGKVESKNSSGQDVTAEYQDYSIRLENAEKARQRYLELLEKAENVEAALLVEKELERLNETIELLKGEMNRIDHLTAYSTISVYLKEKKKPGIIGYVGVGVYKAVKWLFVRN
jgi:hypothetical protein